ncbi:MAG: hypothetical protein ABFS16_10700 [Bacteroidota bacterium]
MNDKLNMDKSVRDKFNGFSVQPPPHVWNNIQGQMAMQKKKKRLAYIGWISAAAVVVFAFLAGWFFNQSQNESKPLAEQQQTVQTERTQQTDDAQQTDSDFIEEEKLQIAEFTGEEEQESSTVSRVPATDVTIAGQEETSALTARIERVSLQLLEGIEAMFSFPQPEVYLAERKEQQPEIFLTETEKVLVAGNIETIGKTAEKGRNWILGMHLSPGYSSHTASHSQYYSQNMTYSGETGGSNVGGGMSVQYKTGKKLRVESGVYYSQSGQASNTTFDLFALNQDAAYGKNESLMATAADAPAFANTVNVSSSGMQMNSTAGVINMEGTPKGAEIRGAMDYQASYSNTLYSNGEFSQVFEFVEIPLYLRYSLLDKKIGIELMGGLNAGVVVGNSAYIDNEYGLQRIGTTEDISTLNLSSTVGIGVNYALGNHFSLAVEPRLNYYLNSINTNPDVNYRPYRVGVFTGIYYEF